MRDAVEVFESSGNVFADLGLPHARELYVEALTGILEARCARGSKPRLTDALRRDIESLETGLTAEQVVAATGAKHVATMLTARYLGHAGTEGAD